MSLKKRLLSKEFVVLAEMHTPKGVNISELVNNARRIKGRIDAVVIPDMDNGVMRMSALAGGVLMHQQGIEAVINVYCRDRNRMAIQGDILAAHVLGIQNLIVVKGEEIANCDHKDAKVVDDLDEIQILEVVSGLQNGTDMAGFDLAGAPEFTLGCTLGKFADQASLEKEIQAAKQKVDAGARFIITPPIFDIDYFLSAADKIKALNVPVIASVFLIKSVGIARYMAVTEPESRIGEDLIKRIRKSRDRENESLKIAGESIKALKGKVDGVLAVTLGWEHRLPTILDYAQL